MVQLLALLIAAIVAGAPVLVDRIAVIVGKQVIKTSDVDRDVRVTCFINRQQIDLSAAARRKAAERLVDQLIIRQEVSEQGYSRASDADASELLNEITRERFQGSDALLKAALLRYGLTKEILDEQLLWQLTVLRYIDQRFRPGVMVTDEEIQAYYNAHLSEFKREYPKDFSLQTLSPKIKTSVEGERVDKEFDAWLDEARKRNRIEYKEAAFR
jgi:hypothetical protein